ncbi:restriction endonuclease [Escherichia coli]|nr:restriction endonuclease [Escherichia coli]TZE52563.1 restriction endonuclease [Escherichia coli]
MLPSETMIWQPEFTDKTLSRKPGAVQSNWKTCYRWRRNMHLTNWLHMAYQVIPISQ